MWSHVKLVILLPPEIKLEEMLGKCYDLWDLKDVIDRISPQVFAVQRELGSTYSRTVRDWYEFLFRKFTVSQQLPKWWFLVFWLMICRQAQKRSQERSHHTNAYEFTQDSYQWSGMIRVVLALLLVTKNSNSRPTSGLQTTRGINPVFLIVFQSNEGITLLWLFQGVSTAVFFP